MVKTFWNFLGGNGNGFKLWTHRASAAAAAAAAASPASPMQVYGDASILERHHIPNVKSDAHLAAAAAAWRSVCSHP